MTAGVVQDRFPLHHRKDAARARVKSVGHLVPAIVLILAAIESFTTGELAIIRILEFAIGSAFIILLVQEWRHLRHTPHAHPHGPAWLELASAGILALEAFHLWHRHHGAELAGAPYKLHILPWLYALLACVYVVLTFAAPSLAARRSLRFNSQGFSICPRPISPTRHLLWSDLRAITPAESPHDLLLHPRSGRAPDILKLAHYSNAPELRAAILSRAPRHLQAP